MNNIWSDKVQGVMTLYLSRKLRFNDIFSEQYEKLFSIDKKKKLRILELGCGPGALAGALHRWYPEAEVTAIDRDSRFIEFAKENEPGIEFREGDITKLPFEDEAFDVVISNTVCEHIEPRAFYSEQHRVLKPGGICLCLSARKGVMQRAECLKITDIEKAFWDSFDEGEDIREKYEVGKYYMSEQELPLAMEDNGFKKVSTGYAVIDLTPDNPKYSEDMALDMINADRLSEIEAAESSHSRDADRIISLLNEKYDKRIQLYKSGNRQWDTNTSITMIIRGEKEE